MVARASAFAWLVTGTGNIVSAPGLHSADPGNDSTAAQSATGWSGLTAMDIERAQSMADEGGVSAVITDARHARGVRRGLDGTVHVEKTSPETESTPGGGGE